MPSYSLAVNPQPSPIGKPDRIGSLDALRGVALLGILLVNIFSFAQPHYSSPYAYGDLHGANFAVWLFSHTFAYLKFLSIFSMLFGAGVYLFTGEWLNIFRCSSDGYPFTRANNINGVDDGYTGGKKGTGSITMTAPNAITRFQDVYVEKVIDTLSDLPNVIDDQSMLDAPLKSQAQEGSGLFALSTFWSRAHADQSPARPVADELATHGCHLIEEPYPIRLRGSLLTTCARLRVP